MSSVRTVDDESLAEARTIIGNGGLVVIPTDTVYGVACDPRNAKAIARIYEAKHRPRFKALQVLLASVDQLDELGLDLPAPLNRLAAQFLPGAFSPIAVAREDCDLATVNRARQGFATQGIRIPNSAVTLRILRQIGPLAASSANRSGEESAQTVEEAQASLGDAVDLYLNGGPTQGHVASTVVAANPLSRDGIDILREGVIPQSVIRRAIHLNGGGLGA
ncbi:MAG: L-threonylcarbamoyladenylate synthase [Bifidobacterium scardovii]|uniref:L-threonylcarbamoyladenylate synthase n=1 Tax=Bifidobacterium scardovii TaxID=158787 RepID=UPI0006682965|nr:L-threonylcarbamoyladenylate synthase [Bifidobacterium scardovii]MBS6947230.1 threonylcarbamoyl-AMP synthase [Bifidobacterium scardovii]MDU3737091.1 L-threonylcarbamoyladenylate synthase [Bifidobacterium scardovii]MDU5297711.1 L-threonylcarbamoyladenylate synthase [Bifidobacterium scardovii]MDU5611807.1 L-threonylcarbamoyladenylate synthase [Bifidobacterium scardovii]MDU5887085.1 L-threonylcarbamoyladenylate synthase [Bifidobacterium scardovii]